MGNQTTLKNFIEGINKIGFAKSSYFELTFYTYDGMSDTRLFSLLCHTAGIPGYNINSTPGKIYGLGYKIPTGIAYDPLNVSFYIDNSFAVPSLIYKMRDEKQISLKNYSPKYRVDTSMFKCSLTVYDGGNNYPVAEYVMENCYVDSIQQTPISWSAHNQILNMNVNITYEYLYECVMDFTGEMNRTPIENSSINKEVAASVGDTPKSGSNIIGFIRNGSKSITGVLRTAQGYRATVSDYIGQVRDVTKGITDSIQGVTGAVTGVVGSTSGLLSEIGGVGRELNSARNEASNQINNTISGLKGSIGNFF